MSTVKPLGTVPLPAAGGSISLHINLETGPATGQPPFIAVSVVGEMDGKALDFGVRREHIAADNLPADAGLLAGTGPVADLIAEYRERLADVAVQLARLGLSTPDGIPVVFTVDDLEFLRHCLSLVQQRWREAIDDANTAAQRPQRHEPPTPGYLNVEPTSAGYRAAARIFGAELARVEQFGQRLAGLFDLAQAAAGDDGDLT
jgi:hypothetical protein